MAKFVNKFKKKHFPYFGSKNFFPGIYGCVMHFIWVSSNIPKFREKKLIIQFQQNAQTEVRNEGRRNRISK